MIKYRKFKENDALECWALIAKVFWTLNKNEGNPSAIKSAVRSYDPKTTDHEQLKKRFKSSDIVYVAINDKKIIWVIRWLNKRIQALFVEEKYHGKWVGKKLLKLFEENAKKNKSTEIKLKSSLYATSFYQKQGYKKTTWIRNFSWGIKVQPMKKILN